MTNMGSISFKTRFLIKIFISIVLTLINSIALKGLLDVLLNYNQINYSLKILHIFNEFK